MTDEEIRATASDTVTFLAGVIDQAQPERPGDYAARAPNPVPYEVGVAAAAAQCDMLVMLGGLNGRPAETAMRYWRSYVLLGLSLSALAADFSGHDAVSRFLLVSLFLFVLAVLLVRDDADATAFPGPIEPPSPVQLGGYHAVGDSDGPEYFNADDRDL